MKTKFKLNSNLKVQLQNLGTILPKHSGEIASPKSVAFTPSTETKLNKIRAKYKISRSAVIRILLESFPEELL